MPFNDVVFYIALSVLGVGLSMIVEHKIFGIILIVIGLLGIVYSIRGHLAQSGSSQWVGIMLLVLTWLAIGYDIYDRHRHTSQNPGNAAWDDKTPLEKIYNRKFTNETVALDGRHFINPVFDNVTFFYQGTGGVLLENPTYILHDGKLGSRLASRNKVVTMTIKIYANLLNAVGVPVYSINLGPDATLDSSPK